MFSTIVILKINKQHINIWSRYDLRRSFARSIKMPFKILHKRYKLGRILNRSRIDRGVSISAHRRTRETLLICKCNILKLILSVPILYIVVNCSWDHKSWNGLAGRRERRGQDSHALIIDPKRYLLAGCNMLLLYVNRNCCPLKRKIRRRSSYLFIFNRLVLCFWTPKSLIISFLILWGLRICSDGIHTATLYSSHLNVVDRSVRIAGPRVLEGKEFSSQRRLAVSAHRHSRMPHAACI